MGDFVGAEEKADSSNLCQLPLIRQSLQTILENIPSAIVVMEKPDGVITYANKRAIELHGVNPCGLKIAEHASRLKILTLAGKLFLPEELYTYKALFQGETTRNALAVIERPDGKLFTVNVSAKPLTDEEGNINACIAIFDDVTDYFKAQESLGKSEERLNRAQTIAKLGSWEYNVQEDKALWSNELFNIFGLKPQQYGPNVNSYLSLIHPDDREKVLKQSQQLKMNEVLKLEYRLISSDGLARTIYSERMVQEVDEQGAPKIIVGVEQDITERKQAEKALKESEERYRTLFSNIGEAFALHEMLFDSQGVPNDYRFLEVNAAFEKQTGLSADQIVGRTVREVLPDLEPFWIETYGRVVVTGEPVRFENYNRSTDRHYEVYAFRPVEGRFAVIFTDITERKQLQHRLEVYTRDLEKLVEERTKQLRDAERLATIGQIAGMVGHDIRNPLQAIVNELYFAKQSMAERVKDKESQDALESIGIIQEQADYISKIVSDLQDYAKPLKPELVVVDICRLIPEALKTIAIPNNIQLGVACDEPIPPLKLDPTFMRRILSNLTNNAVQAMPNGGKLTVKASKKENSAIITVEDTGVGIPEADRPKLFTPLFTTKAKGQGFGLPVVKRFVEALGGTITFESEVGKGTRFIVELPFTN